MKRLLVFAFATSLALGAAPAGASHDWNGYHWARSANPISLKVVDSVVDGWDPLLAAVSNDWGASSVINTSIESGATGILDRLLCNAISGKIRACNFSYGPTLWFGIATVWLNGSHITQATTKVNDYYFAGSYGNDTARRHVLCQEIGHDLGLDHHRQESCMDDTNSTLSNPAYVDPNAHDYEELASLYAHLDGGTAGSSSSPAGPEVLVGRDGDQTVLTFIFWVR